MEVVKANTKDIVELFNNTMGTTPLIEPDLQSPTTP